MKRLLLIMLLAAWPALPQNRSQGDIVLVSPYRLIFGDPGTNQTAYFQHTAANTVTLTGNLVITGTCTNCVSSGGLTGLTAGTFLKAGSPTTAVNSSFLTENATNLVSTSNLAFSQSTVTFSATPVLNATSRSQTITLTADVTSSTITNSSAGEVYTLNICQDATGGRKWVWPALFTQSFTSGASAVSAGPGGIVTTPNACTASSWVYNGTNWIAINNLGFGKPSAGGYQNTSLTSSLCRAAPWGNDLNDGLDWGSAKQTISGCITKFNVSTPGITTGTIEVMDGGGPGCRNPVYASPVTDAGIWLFGPHDPNYPASLPAGSFAWDGSLLIRGVGGTYSEQNIGIGPVVCVRGGSATDPTKPLIWVNGMSTNTKFERIGTTYPAKFTAIGINSNGSRDADNGTQTGGVTFENIIARLSSDNSAYGPTLDIGGQSFELAVRRSWIRGNFGSTDKLKQPSIVMDAGTPVVGGIGLVSIEDCELDGGIYFNALTSATGSLFIRNVIGETTNPALNAEIWLENWGPYNHATIDNIQAADAPGSVNVKVTASPGTVANLAGSIMATHIGSYSLAAGMNASGPFLNLGGDSVVAWNSATSTPLGQRGAGFYAGGNNSTPSVHLAAQVDSEKFLGAPVATRLVNLIPQTGTAWAAGSGTATVTTGVTAPTGALAAFNLTSASRVNRALSVSSGTIGTVAIGDWVVFGVAMRRASGTAGTQFNQCGVVLFFTDTAVRTDISSASSNTTMCPTVAGVGDWMWEALAMKITNAGTGSTTLQVQLFSDSNYSTDYYAQVLHYIHAGTMSDNEVMRIANDLQPIADTLAAGDVSTQRKTRFSFGVPNSNFFGKMTDATFTADRVFTWPDVSGTVLVGGGSNPVTVGSVTFSSLPASSNGSIIYCSDCNSTCTAGSSTGQICFRVNGAWAH